MKIYDTIGDAALLAFKCKKEEIITDKPVYLTFIVLQLSIIHMCENHYVVLRLFFWSS